MRLSGMPVHLATTCKNVIFIDGDAFFFAVLRARRSRTDSSFSLACFSLSRMDGGAFEILFFDRAFLLRLDRLRSRLRGL